VPLPSATHETHPAGACGPCAPSARWSRGHAAALGGRRGGSRRRAGADRVGCGACGRVCGRVRAGGPAGVVRAAGTGRGRMRRGNGWEHLRGCGSGGDRPRYIQTGGNTTIGGARASWVGASASYASVSSARAGLLRQEPPDLALSAPFQSHDAASLGLRVPATPTARRTAAGGRPARRRGAHRPRLSGPAEHVSGPTGRAVAAGARAGDARRGSPRELARWSGFACTTRTAGVRTAGAHGRSAADGDWPLALPGRLERALRPNRPGMRLGPRMRPPVSTVP
jgi:hypothetical protein